MDFLDTMFLVLDERTEECPFLFENNEKLDLTKTCRREDIKDSFKLKTSGNLVDCGKDVLDFVRNMQTLGEVWQDLG